MHSALKINSVPSALSIVFTLLIFLPKGFAINCYTCNSWNGSDTNCHDPYNPANSVYTRDCMVGKNKHVGKFPAYFCLKIIGRKDTTNESLVIRACILENMDNQCGMFRFENDYFTGCILTCDYNGCNESAESPRPDFKSQMSISLATIVYGLLFVANHQ